MSVATKAIQTATSGQLTFTKFPVATDTGLTGSHQADIYISKPSIPILFDEPGIKGQNKEKWVKVKRQDDFVALANQVRNRRESRAGKSPEHHFSFPVSKLTSLAAKTTCKDRWSQILNEADLFRDGCEYLCILQQGVSAMKMDEMKSEKVTLVVPKAYSSTYPRDKQDRIWSLHKFVEYVKEQQND